MEDLILHINDKEFKASFNKTNNGNIFINEKPFQVDLFKRISKDIFAFSVNQRMFQIEFELNEFGDSQINIDGLTFDISITNETKQLLEKYINQSSAGGSKGPVRIKAPMPGMVVKIMVEEGSTVKKGDKLLIVEAMKMENALLSPGNGVVKSIKIKEGMAVEKDMLMLEIDT